MTFQDLLDIWQDSGRALASLGGNCIFKSWWWKGCWYFPLVIVGGEGCRSSWCSLQVDIVKLFDEWSGQLTRQPRVFSLGHSHSLTYNNVFHASCMKVILGQIFRVRNESVIIKIKYKFSSVPFNQNRLICYRPLGDSCSFIEILWVCKSICWGCVSGRPSKSTFLTTMPRLHCIHSLGPLHWFFTLN